MKLAGSQRAKLQIGFRARFLLLAASLFISAAIGEIGLRIFFHETFGTEKDEKNLMYQYDSQLGWFPVPNSQNTFTGSRTITIRHNSRGLRDVEPMKTGKPGILFLGDSFVWGVDVEASERFTDKLQARHPEWSIYNFGASGYGTDQEYLLLGKHFDEYKPRVVFLIFCSSNDDSDNCWNVRGGYYKPYCTLSGTTLKLEGIPVPHSCKWFFAKHRTLCKSYLMRLFVTACYRVAAPAPVKHENPTGGIIRDLQKYLELRGATFLIGLQHEHPHLEEFLRYFKIPYVDLTTSLVYDSFGAHWTPEGHTFVCNKIEKFLSEGKYMDQATPTMSH